MLPPSISREQFRELFSRFEFSAESAVSCAASQNFVYQVTRGTTRFIARISTARHRSRAEIEAELDWIYYLNKSGISVSLPVPSKSGALCEELTNGSRTYFVSGFCWAPGRKPQREDLSPSLCYRVGAQFAKLHTASACAELLGMRWNRKNWQSSRLLNEDFSESLAPMPEDFRSSVRSAVREIASFPTATFSSGLIHADINFGNIHLDGEQIWLFDFDNCEYGFFAQDMVTMLYDSIYSKVVKHVSASALTSTVANLWHNLIRGYRDAGGGVTFSSSLIRRFFLLREAILYVHYHRVLPKEQWADPYLAQMRRNVETDTHVLDFTALAA